MTLWLDKPQTAVVLKSYNCLLFYRFTNGGIHKLYWRLSSSCETQPHQKNQFANYWMLESALPRKKDLACVSPFPNKKPQPLSKLGLSI